MTDDDLMTVLEGITSKLEAIQGELQTIAKRQDELWRGVATVADIAAQTFAVSADGELLNSSIWDEAIMEKSIKRLSVAMAHKLLLTRPKGRC